jgi:hypothetical protein
MLASVGEHVLPDFSQEDKENMAANGRSHATRNWKLTTDN